MPNTSSSRTFSVMSSSSVSTREHTFLSQLIMTMAIVIFLIGLCPYASSSPTPSSSNDQNNQLNYESNGLMINQNDFRRTDDSSVLSSPVQHSQSGSSSPIWYVQPRTHANQFLMSHVNDNEIIVPKQLTRFNNDGQMNDNDDDDLNAYMTSGILLPTKRSSYGNNARFAYMNKRKQPTKPPMEVMNEIVNSIYL